MQMLRLEIAPARGVSAAGGDRLGEGGTSERKDRPGRLLTPGEMSGAKRSWCLWEGRVSPREDMRAREEAGRGTREQDAALSRTHPPPTEQASPTPPRRPLLFGREARACCTGGSCTLPCTATPPTGSGLRRTIQAENWAGPLGEGETGGWCGSELGWAPRPRKTQSQRERPL